MFLWRPIVVEPPIYSQRDLKEWIMLADVLDAHEAIDLRMAMAEKATEPAKSSGRLQEK